MSTPNPFRAVARASDVQGRQRRLQALLGTTAVASALGLAMLQPTPAKADPPPAQSVILPSGNQTSVSPQASNGADHTKELGNPQAAAGGDAAGWSVTQPSNSWYTVTAPVQFSATGGGGGDADIGSYDGGKGGDAGGIDFTVGAPTGSGYTYLSNSTAQSNAIQLSTKGGNGGAGSEPSGSGNGGSAGAAGTAGNITFNAAQGADPTQYSYIAAGSGGVAIDLQSQGGNGGAGGESSARTGTVIGRIGANGAAGGDISANLAAIVNSQGSGLIAVSNGGDGGSGGEGSSAIGATGKGGAGGQGANGGAITITQSGGNISALGSDATDKVQYLDGQGNPLGTAQLGVTTAAIQAESLAGVGGSGGSGDGGLGASNGGAGGRAGDGGGVTVNLQGSGIYQSSGYDQYRSTGAISTAGNNAVGVLAVSAGGAGGYGGTAGGVFGNTGGKGGTGGNGGNVNVTLAQSGNANPYTLVTTTGDHADAIVAMSVGGGGGYGGSVSDGSFLVGYQTGGKAGDGGNGGQVSVSNGAWTNSGGAWTLQTPYVINTTGTDSFGIYAASIGGGGGRGGDATGVGIGILTNVIGGAGGVGGDGGSNFQSGTIGTGNGSGSSPPADVNVANYGIIQTAGAQSIGILSQSVGGGGGAGGAANSIDTGAVLTQAFAVGGDGGKGGNGGMVTTANFGQIITMGANATGVLGQSIGGGGGNGGSSSAKTFPVNDGDTPSITLTQAIGGAGGVGGDGGSVSLLNTGIVVTQGPSAFGVVAQSVGGGGGNGGDASVGTQAYNQATLTVQTSIGGDGGGGGKGGSILVANSGLVQTQGSESAAVFAQSVGGGGGNGGSGESNQGAYHDGGDASAEITVAVGGKGGVGGAGGDVTVNNFINDNNVPDASRGDYHDTPMNGNGGILTAGLSSPGIFAQSIGGGGGNGGDAVGKGGGGQLTVNIGIGGAGGAAGAGGQVNVDNGSGAIATFGASSPAIMAQSIGGGGGNGGNATTGSGTNPQKAYPEFVANQFPDIGPVVNDIYDLKSKYSDVNDQIDNLKKLQEAYDQANGPETPNAGEGFSGGSLKVDVGAGIGGDGGAAGDGGDVVLRNGGALYTQGPGSAGMIAQSVGGGGGTGGAATAQPENTKPKAGVFSAAINVGGQDGSTGNGGHVSVVNDTDATITTVGDLSYGIVAQSIGGGGGIAGISTSSVSLGGATLSLGGDSKTSGNGGQVDVTAKGQIQTNGNDAIGVLAQSIGGGGGIAAITGQTYDPTTQQAVSSTQQALGGPVYAQLNDPGAKSLGGAVNVSLKNNDGGGQIVTKGINSYGILAQSIGGGGGLFIVDPDPGAAQADPDNHNCGPNRLYTAVCVNGTVTHASNAGAVNVATDPNTSISTSGDGAVGILAQSIGGGGAIVNGMNGVDLDWGHNGVVRTETERDAAGDAGSVQVISNGDITTTGAYAHGIFAQAASGGGGLSGTTGVDSSGAGLGTVFFGSSSNKATACGYSAGCLIGQGNVNVDVQGGAINVSGPHSWGIVAISDGNAATNGSGDASGNRVNVSVANGAKVIATGQAAGAITIDGSDSAVVSIANGGVVDGSSSSQHIAVAGLNGNAFEVDNAGELNGNVVGNGAKVVNTGQFNPGDTVDLGAGGQLVNHGVINVGQVGATSKTTLTGNFVQASDGVLNIDYDGKTGASDQLVVNGTATLGGKIALNPTALHKAGPISVITATGGVTLAQTPVLGAPNGPPAPYTNDETVVGNSLQVQINANFNNAAADLGKTQRAVASHLQQVWDNGNRLDTGFTALYQINGDAAAYGSALNSMSGQALGQLNAVRFRNGQTFATHMLDGCPDGTDEMGRCVWGRVSDTHTRQGTTADSAGYTVDATSAQSGASIPLTPHLTLSGSMGLTTSTLTGDYASTIQGTEWRFGGMLTYRTGHWELSGAVDGSHGDYTSNRNIVIGKTTLTAKSSPELSDIGAHFRVAYDQSFGAWSVKPYVDLHASRTFNNAFTETGAQDLNLAVESESDTVLAADAGLEVSSQVKVGHGLTLKPFVSAAVETQNNGDWAARSRFVGQDGTDGFKAVTPLPNVLTEVAFGTELASGSKWDLRLEYGADFARGYTAQTGGARFAVKF